MSAQFWIGLAMLPAGALALALVVFVPWFVVAWISDRRQRYPFVMGHTKRNSLMRGGYRTLAALVALAQFAIAFRFAFGWRLIVIRDRPGMRPADPGSRHIVHAIEDAIEENEA